MDKGAVFIDGGYFHKVQESLGIRVDYLKFSEKICRNANVERFKTYYYDCAPYQSNPPTDAEKSFYTAMGKKFNALRRYPRFEVKLGRLSKISDGKLKQKGVDNLLTIDLVKLSSRRDISKAFLVTGDSDFVPAIETAKNEAVIVQILYAKIGDSIGIHDELYKCCDEWTLLDKNYLSDVLLKKEISKI